MNRRHLRDVLDAEAVAREAYRLDGDSAEDSVSIGPIRGGWRVWFTERGSENTLGEFDTEDAACQQLLSLLLADDANRWVLVGGPADAAVADRQLDEWLAGVGWSRGQLRPVDLRTEDLPWSAETTRRRHWILRTVTRGLPVTMLDDDAMCSIRRLPEFRMGVHRVDVRLRDGSIVRDVFVSGGRVTRVAGCDTIPFSGGAVAAVLEQDL